MKAETAVEEANDSTIDAIADKRQTGLEKRKMEKKERPLGVGGKLI